MDSGCMVCGNLMLGWTFSDMEFWVRRAERAPPLRLREHGAAELTGGCLVMNSAELTPEGAASGAPTNGTGRVVTISRKIVQKVGSEEIAEFEVY